VYNNILVPVSFEAGRDAHKALEVAQAIRSAGGKISIFHVIEHLPKYANDLLPEDHVETARKAVTAEIAPMVEGIADVDVVVVEGHSARTILDFAEKNNKDCIVITSHRPGMQDLFFGSTAARVVRHAQCSVHVIR
jgi:nucleotide-binding universal stress UspA family protein